MRDPPHLLRVGDDNTVDIRRQNFDNGRGIASRLDDHVIIMGEFLPGESLQAVTSHGNAAELR
ncbi:hypothetical protein ACVWW6_000250 [Bradyrhizobium sp. USDA 3311]